MLKMTNPTAPGRASMGSEIQSWGAHGLDLNTAALALKVVFGRVAVSEPVALVIAAHAGLLREAR